jgi:hypothetical protein
MNRHFFSALLVLGSLIGPTGCSRSDKSEPSVKGTNAPAQTKENKPAATKSSGPSLEGKFAPVAPAVSGKTKPQP